MPSVSTQICPSLGDVGSVGCAREPATTAQDAVVASVVRNLPALPVWSGRLTGAAAHLIPVAVAESAVSKYPFVPRGSWSNVSAPVPTSKSPLASNAWSRTAAALAALAAADVALVAAAVADAAALVADVAAAVAEAAADVALVAAAVALAAAALVDAAADAADVAAAVALAAALASDVAAELA